MIEFTVEHVPRPQPRHRATSIGGLPRMYLPSNSNVIGFKTAIRMAFGKNEKQIGPLEIVVDAWFPRPLVEVWKTKPMPHYWHTKKPDADNVLKAILDALNGLAWCDDAEISSATIRKFVCDGDSVPRVEILIRKLEQ
jgi:Holliday junction resolvase RusA-like endonuclease